jgi:hypothetical protein
MSDQRRRPPKKSEEPAAPETRDFELEPAGEVVVEHHPNPPSQRPDLQIHPRRRLPAVPKAPCAPVKDDPKKEDS